MNIISSGDGIFNAFATPKLLHLDVDLQSQVPIDYWSFVKRSEAQLYSLWFRSSRYSPYGFDLDELNTSLAHLLMLKKLVVYDNIAISFDQIFTLFPVIIHGPQRGPSLEDLQIPDGAVAGCRDSGAKISSERKPDRPVPLPQLVLYTSVRELEESG